MPVDVNSIMEKAKEYEGTHQFLAEELLIPNVNKCDNIRINMFSNHLPQTLVLANGEYPNVYTNFEDQVGKHSVAYKLSDRKWKVIGKFKKNKLNTTLILLDDENNVELYNFHPADRITERYGYKNINTAETKEVNDTIEKNEVIFKSTSYDEDMHFCYGTNLKVMYLAWNNLTYEDAIVISETAAKKFDAYSPDEFDITLNKNDIPLNLYGDENNYKCFPDIGEIVNPNRIACARRRLMYDSLLYDFNINNISSVNYDTDTVFYTTKGSVITDIDVFCNADMDYLKKYPYYNQIVSYIESNTNYYTELYNFLCDYIGNDTYKCSDEVKYWFKRADLLTSPDTVFKFDGNNFDNLVVKIKTLSVNHLVIGSKLSGRYGNKGCVSAILPVEEMPVNEFGEHADVILNPMGVVGRENMAQLNEHELNFIGDTVLRQTKDMKTFDEKFNHICKFFEIVDPTITLRVLKGFKQVATEEDKKKFLDSCYEKGLYIRQSPFFGNITVDDFSKLYDYFGYHPYSFTVQGKPIEEKLIMAKEYMIRLKHDPKSKFSARASGDLNINNIPSKSNSFKYHNSLFSKTPVKIGEMEFVALLLTKSMDIITKYLKQTSSNPDERKNFNSELLTRNVFDIDRIELIGTPSVTSQIIKTYLLSMGLENIDNRAFTEIQKLIIDTENEVNN